MTRRREKRWRNLECVCPRFLHECLFMDMLNLPCMVSRIPFHSIMWRDQVYPRAACGHVDCGLRLANANAMASSAAILGVANT